MADPSTLAAALNYYGNSRLKRREFDGGEPPTIEGLGEQWQGVRETVNSALGGDQGPRPMMTDAQVWDRIKASGGGIGDYQRYLLEQPPDPRVAEALFGATSNIGKGIVPAITKALTPKSFVPRAEAAELPGSGNGVAKTPTPPFAAPPIIKSDKPANVFPQVAERYPLTGPPIPMIDKVKGVEYLGKQLTSEALGVNAARQAAQKEINAGRYTPYFDPAKRFDVNPAGYGTFEDTKSILAVKPETRAKFDAHAGSPEALSRLNDAFMRGMRQVDGAGNWYHMGQLEDEFIKQYGPEQGRKLFAERFAESMSATTGGAAPTDNLMMAHYGNYLKQKGTAIPDNAYDYPFPIGGRYASGNMRMFDKMVMQEGGVTPENAKRYNFRNNFLGNAKNATLDEQMSGLFDPKMAMPPSGRYGHYEQVLHDQSAAQGVDPRFYQEVGWAGAKDAKTKGGYKADPMISTVNEAIERTSRVTGLPQDEVVRRMVRANIPLYGSGAGIAAVSGTEDRE